MKPFKSLRRFKWSDVPKRRRQLTYVMTAVGFSTYTLESKFKDSHVGTRDMNWLTWPMCTITGLFDFQFTTLHTVLHQWYPACQPCGFDFRPRKLFSACLFYPFLLPSMYPTYNELSCHVGSRHARSKFVHVFVSVVMMSWRARFIFEQLFWIAAGAVAAWDGESKQRKILYCCRPTHVILIHIISLTFTDKNLSSSFIYKSI